MDCRAQECSEHVVLSARTRRLYRLRATSECLPLSRGDILLCAWADGEAADHHAPVRSAAVGLLAARKDDVGWQRKTSRYERILLGVDRREASTVRTMCDQRRSDDKRTARRRSRRDLHEVPAFDSI